MGVGLNHPYESLQTRDILQFHLFTTHRTRKKKKSKTSKYHGTLHNHKHRRFTQKSRSQETEPKTGDDLSKKKGEGQTWGLVAPSLKQEKDLSASIPQLLTNLTDWKFDLHLGLHCNVCKRDSCQDPGSGSPVDFSSMLLFD